MSTLQYNNCKYDGAFTELLNTRVCGKSYNDVKNDFFTIFKKRYSNSYMSGISINMYINKSAPARHLYKHYPSEMIANMAKIKLYSNLTEDDEKVYSDSFLERINELLIKLGNNQPEIFPSVSGKLEMDFGNSSNRLIVFLYDDLMTLIKSTNNGKPQIIAKSIKTDTSFLISEISRL